EGMVPEEDLIRIPAVQKFNGSDFSVQLPIPGVLTEALGGFKPDIVHSHHPFLIGDTAMRMASSYNVPLVFTHHTLYEQNVHYVPGNADVLQKFVIELATGYANLADQVFAPSQSVEGLIKKRGVQTPVDVVPTGILLDQFARGAAKSFRKEHNIPAEAFVVGYLGRLAPEKNLDFLGRVVMEFLKKNPDVYFLVVGHGPSEETIRTLATEAGVMDRLRVVGSLTGKEKVNAYHAMNVFAFASQSETQGLVLTEALASRVPVVGVDASGVRDVIEDKINGCLIMQENQEEFLQALDWVRNLPQPATQKMKRACRYTAERFSLDKCVDKALSVYQSLKVASNFTRRGSENSVWEKTGRLIRAEVDLVVNMTKAVGAALIPLPEKQDHPEIPENPKSEDSVQKGSML
ncbi:MAG: glycosyltransferase, partial [Candidatus Omnitrophica bacterium]|nr:glycosyltransferase [Candidatus Omnitrophota bacterium]